MPRLKKRLVVWLMILAFCAVGQVSAMQDHELGEEGDEPAEITYCSKCNCCKGKFWTCSRRHSAECGLFGCPDHDPAYTACDN